MTEDKCVLCGEASLLEWGGENIHTRKDIAGIETDVYSSHKYSVYKCSSCGVASKLPCPGPDELKKYYQSSKDGQWGGGQSPENRMFLELEKLALSEVMEPGKALDFGCSNGELLLSWSDRWQKYGVELSDEARKSAERNGLEVIQNYIGEKRYLAYFDVITMIDVIEHLPNPLELFSDLVPMLKEGGILIVFTGNTDHIWYRISKGSYWYCDIPEHIIFYNLQSITYLAGETGLELIARVDVPHMRSAWHNFSYLKQFVKNVAFLFFGALIRYVPVFEIRRTTFPSFTAASDHSIFIMKKK